MSLLIIAIVISACGGTAEPTAIPTETATPITDLRFVATAVPAGLPENPLQMVIEPVTAELYVEPEVTEEPDVGEVLLPISASQAELDLEDAILEYSNVTVDIVPVAKPADALQALCEATDTVSAVWVDGVSFSAALAQNCGEPIYVVQKRIDGQFVSGEGGVLILSRAELNNPQLGNLNGRVFCRVDVNDFYSWLLPLMIFRANNIDSSSFEMIVDYDTPEDLVSAVADGECFGAGLSGVVYGDIADDDEELEEQISVAYGSPPIPYAVLMYPVEIQLGIRVALNEGLAELVEDDDANELLQAFLGQDTLQLVDRDDFAEYEAFLQDVGLDFSILGN